MSGLRKLFIAVMSLAGVLAIYLIYSYVAETPQISVDGADDFVRSPADGNAGEFGDRVGKIGDVGVATVKKPKFIHRNKDKEVDREFGFETLLHEEKDRWEIEKPYLNIFQPNFTSYVTADKGTVDVETAVGRPTPKDATFAGNVVIHILPEDSNTIKESFLYLDDVEFLSEKTQFSTAGPVKFISEDAQMLGRGLELVYNDQLQRLEFLRIVDLESLRLKGVQAVPGSAVGAKGRTSASTTAEAGTEPPTAGTRATTKNGEGDYYKCVFSKNVLIDTPQQVVFANEQVSINNIFWAKPSSNGRRTTGDERRATSDERLATSDERRATSDERLATSDERRATSDERRATSDERRATSDERRATSDEILPLAGGDIMVTCNGGVLVAPMNGSISLTVLSPSKDSNLPQEDNRQSKIGNRKWFDGRTTFVTRRVDYDASTGEAVAGGPSELTFYASNTSAAEANEAPVPVKITAQKQTKFLPASNQVIFDGNCLCVMPQQDPNVQGDYTLFAPTLIVNLLEEKAGKAAAISDVLATGPVELTFYVDDFAGTGAGKAALPARVTARKEARFLAASNQVVFEDDCLCVMSREDPNFRETYLLSAAKLIVDLPGDTNDGSTGPPSRAASRDPPDVWRTGAGIEHLTASGGVVRLATVKTAGKKLLGGIELKCRQFDYDAQEQLFLAAGPGVVKVDNSHIPEPNAQTPGFSLRRPCYAFLQNFDALKYFSKSNHLMADAGSQGTLRIDYIPLIKGKFGQHIVATANHVEADLIRAADTPEAGTELATLAASGGITYEDDKNQFAGSRLFYDHGKSLINVKGDPPDVRGGQPCYLNGTLVDGIEYNLKTGKARARVAGPGTLQIK